MPTFKEELKMLWMGANYRAPARCAAPPPMEGFTASEQAKVETAWNMIESAPNAHLLSAVHKISRGYSNAGATGGGGLVTIDKNITTSVKDLAGTLMHEAAHCHYTHPTSTPRTEAEAVTEENIARAHVGCRTMKDPHNFSWHAANGFSAEEPVQHAYGVDYTTHYPIAQIVAPEPQREADARSWCERWASSPGRAELRRQARRQAQG